MITTLPFPPSLSPATGTPIPLAQLLSDVAVEFVAPAEPAFAAVILETNEVFA